MYNNLRIEFKRGDEVSKEDLPGLWILKGDQSIDLQAVFCKSSVFYKKKKDEISYQEKHLTIKIYGREEKKEFFFLYQKLLISTYPGKIG